MARPKTRIRHVLTKAIMLSPSLTDEMQMCNGGYGGGADVYCSGGKYVLRIAT